MSGLLSILGMVLAAATSFVCGYTYSACADETTQREEIVQYEETVQTTRASELYGTCGTITGMCAESDVFYITTQSGLTYSFSPIAEHYEGETVSLLVSDNGTDIVFDDTVISCGHEVNDRCSTQYSARGIVTSICEETDTFYVTLDDGNVFGLSPVEDWFCGDIATLVLEDNGTDDVSDDIVVSARYCGYVE